MLRRVTRAVRHDGRCRLHRRWEGMRAHRCRVWHTHTRHMHMLRRARRSHRHNATVTRMHCPHRHSIAIAPFRHDLDQCKCVAAIHRMHDTAGVAARNRSLLHRAVTGTRRGAQQGRMPIHSHRPSTDTDPQTNDRFKRRAGYLGTVVSSKTRSGRRWWPGQCVLPYIRWTGPNSASLMGGGASKPFSITMKPARSANAG